MVAEASLVVEAPPARPARPPAFLRSPRTPKPRASPLRPSPRCTIARHSLWNRTSRLWRYGYHEKRAARLQNRTFRLWRCGFHERGALMVPFLSRPRDTTPIPSHESYTMIRDAMRVSLHPQKCLDFGPCGWCDCYRGMPYTFAVLQGFPFFGRER